LDQRHPADCNSGEFTPADTITAELADINREAARAVGPQVTLVDVTDVLCPGGLRCPAVIGKTLARYDQVHYTATFSRQLVPVIISRSEKAGVRFTRRTP
jgi:hypothetical protein